MNCERLDAVELLRFDLTPQEVEKRLDHLDACSRCRRNLEIAVAIQAGAASGNRMSWPWLAVAASLLAAGLWISWWVPGGSKHPDPASLATGQPYPVVALMTRAPSPNPPAGRVLQAYRNRDCPRITQVDGATADTLFLQGVCLYLVNELEPARRALNEGLTLSSRWTEPSLWYLANLALRQNKPREALGLLDELIETDGEYRAEARRLAARLEGLR